MENLVIGLKALAEPTRFRLLALCDGRELAVGELIEILGQSQPRVSRHLKILTEAGLLDRFCEGSRVYYRAARTGAWTAITEALFRAVPENDRIIANDRIMLSRIRAGRIEAAEAFFRDHADDWDRLRALYVDEKFIEEALVEALAPVRTDRFLDLGTGTGRILSLIAPDVETAIGLDKSPEMLKVARASLGEQGLASASFRQGDIYQLPFDDDSFDAIAMHQVLHFLDRPAQALAEAARVLAPGGRLVVVDFAPHGEKDLAKDYHHQHLGFEETEVLTWLKDVSVKPREPRNLFGDPLTVTLWAADKP